jgi:hypothetical protein
MTAHNSVMMGGFTEWAGEAAFDVFDFFVDLFYFLFRRFDLRCHFSPRSKPGIGRWHAPIFAYGFFRPGQLLFGNLNMMSVYTEVNIFK